MNAILSILNHTYNIETEINNYRTQLRNQNLMMWITIFYTYGENTLYMDIIQECENFWDYYLVNVAEARMGVRTSEGFAVMQNVIDRKKLK